MRALITGASGFLGCELARRLHRQGVAVIAGVGPQQNELESSRMHELQRLAVPVVPCDLRRPRPFESVPVDWDTVFHLAAYVRTEEASHEIRINDEGTRRLLGQLPLRGKRVVFTSTLAVADNAPGGEITPGMQCQPRTDYGRTKLAAEQIVREACTAQGAHYTILRLPTLYGPGYRPNGVFDVLPRGLARQKLLARVAWPGRLALMAVDDAAELTYRAAVSAGTVNQVFVVSSNENPTTWEIAQAIAAAIGIPYRPVPLPRPGVRLLRGLLGPWWQTPALPHRLQVTAWRARLLLDGLYCDGTPLARLLGLKFQDWRAGIVRMYAEDPPRSRKACAGRGPDGTGHRAS